MAVEPWLALVRDAICVPPEDLTEDRISQLMCRLMEAQFPRLTARLLLGEPADAGDPPGEGAPNPCRSAGSAGKTPTTTLQAQLTLPSGHPVGRALVEGPAAVVAGVDPTALETWGQVVAAALDHIGRVNLGADLLSEARHEALHDSLTGLANRTLLLDRLEHALQRSGRSGQVVAVMFVDLDRFKSVNDLYGHRVGDQLLVALARRLESGVRSDDTVARLSGDEFVVVCEGLENDAQGEVIAAHLAQTINEPFDVSVGSIPVTASIGLAFTLGADTSAEALIDQADVAMYQAKHSGGRGYRVVDLSERSRTRRLAEMELELCEALDRNELRTVYQPIVETVTGRVVGFEALLRWRNGRLGEIPPETFLPLAERSRLMERMGRWLLEQAGSDLGPLARQIPITLAVNVSGRQLLEGDCLVRAVAGLLESLDGRLTVTLDLTEQTLAHENQTIHSTLAEMKRLGVLLALDDFGVGYSSLNSLSRVPIDSVKVDRSFVTQLGTGSSHQAIVHAVCTLAHVLGMSVVAEGVETARQHEMVTILGCDYSQGYFHSAPRPAGDLAELMAAPLRSGRVSPT